MSVTNLPRSGAAVYDTWRYARDEARYWLRVAIAVYPTCIRRPIRGSPSEYCHNVWYGKKLEWCVTWRWKHFESVFTRFDRIHKRDGQTGGHRVTAWTRFMRSIARQYWRMVIYLIMNFSDGTRGRICNGGSGLPWSPLKPPLSFRVLNNRFRHLINIFRHSFIAIVQHGRSTSTWTACQPRLSIDEVRRRASCGCR